ncbi:hypothetical protein FRC01_007189, partial [Tulasnella sp. 417]
MSLAQSSTDVQQQREKRAPKAKPTASGSNDGVSYGRGNGGGQPKTIGSGKFSGRQVGGGRRDQIWGTAFYGSGYTYSNPGSSVVGRGFPFGYWPMCPGPYTYPYYGSQEFCPWDASDRPGGVLSYVQVNCGACTAAASTNPNSLAAFYVVGDKESVNDMATQLRESPCNADVGAVTDFNNSIPVEQYLQFYRASSFALALSSYQNVAANVSNAPDLGQLPAAIPDGTNTTFLSCLNNAIGSQLLIANASDTLVEQRKLKPIYDALDSGSYKAAIQTCNKLLKKQPQHETIRALKSLALLRANKAEEAIQLCDEILASKPTDDTVLGIMQHVLKHLDRTPEITAMFEDAFKKQPGNEELGAQTFMSHIRVGSWKNAQVIALKLFKSFKQPKYLFWSIMSAVLQAQNAGGVNPGMTDNAPILNRNWITFLSLIDSTFDVIKLNESQSKSETDSVAPATDSEGAGPPPSEAKSTPTSTEGNGEVDPELTPKPTPHPELPLEPQALIDGLRELFERLAKEDGLKERGGHLASLQLEKRVRAREEGQGNSVSDTLISLIKQYFNNFSDKTCCFEDLKPYVASLKDDELASWLTFLKEQDDARDLSTPAGLARLINVFKLQRFSSTSGRSEANEQTDVATYLKAYFEGLPVGKRPWKDLPETELQPADDLAVLAANALVSAWVMTRKETYLHQALVVLEYASSQSKQNYQFRVLAVRIYRLLAANGPALSHYRTMDVKQVQTDTLSHLILSRGSTYSLATVGDVGMTQECITASDIYNQNSSDTADMIIKAFQFEKYSQITEFVEFEDRLDNSLQRDLTRL